MLSIRKKWRPSLMTLIILVVGTLMALPLIGLMTARLTSNQFVRETENSLVSQAAILSEVYAAEYRRHSSGALHGQVLSDHLKRYYGRNFHRKPVSLTTKASTILPQRPDPTVTDGKIDPIYLKIGPTISQLANGAQKTSLAGYQALDARGNIIGGNGTQRGGFGNLPEVKAALKGEVVTLLRYRSDKNMRHPLVSISRDTGFRVFVAMPVIVDDHVVGAVYLTRTPNNLRKFLVRERQTLALVAGSVLLAASLVGLLLWRLIAGPIKELKRQSERVAKGQTAMLEPIDHYGTKEAANLGQSILAMSAKLNQRSASLQSYTAHVTHELKSPLTSIIGAVELLEQSGGRMDAAARQKFYQNIQEDGTRMTRLLDDLRRFAASDMTKTSGHANLKTALERCQREFARLKLEFVGPDDAALPMDDQDLDVVLTQLAQNAAQHGATELSLSALENSVIVEDNGKGISDANLDKIFDPFYTTNRDAGGTGMGLAIVQSTINAYAGTIRAEAAPNGAKFVIEFDTSYS